MQMLVVDFTISRSCQALKVSLLEFWISVLDRMDKDELLTSGTTQLDLNTLLNHAHTKVCVSVKTIVCFSFQFLYNCLKTVFFYKDAVNN